jgi:eukaryotic-like serine/threonine-protein kinase
MEQIADYRLTDSLGEGNHGQFFLAVPPPRLGTGWDRVAIKVLFASCGEDALRRISRELRAFASANSPYLVRLLDAGQDGDRFFYVMEYFPLGSLGVPARSLSRSEVLLAVDNAARAAHALHEVGVVHRGIKPENILLTDDGAKLSDLGLAQSLTPGQTVTAMGPIGSVEYMDPGLLRGERGSRASDIWSIGITLHRALTGESVYGALPSNDPLLAVRKVLSSRPVLSEGLSAGEREVVAACLEALPERRPATASEVADKIGSLRLP